MSKACETFEVAIHDAEALLQHFKQQTDHKAPSSEVLKRAGLIMAMTAWETYVEDRVVEEVESRLRAVEGSHAGKFMTDRLTEELKRFHNPTSDKTRKLFLDYLGFDVTEGWKWNNYDSTRVKKDLDALLKLRGDVVHRATTTAAGTPQAPHPVKIEELTRAIRFLKALVEATDQAIQDQRSAA
jgi:hypothetical protein